MSRPLRGIFWLTLYTPITIHWAAYVTDRLKQHMKATSWHMWATCSGAVRGCSVGKTGSRRRGQCAFKPMFTLVTVTLSVAWRVPYHRHRFHSFSATQCYSSPPTALEQNCLNPSTQWRCWVLGPLCRHFIVVPNGLKLPHFPQSALACASFSSGHEYANMQTATNLQCDILPSMLISCICVDCWVIVELSCSLVLHCTNCTICSAFSIYSNVHVE